MLAPPVAVKQAVRRLRDCLTGEGSKTMWSDRLITSTQAINLLDLHHEHFKTLVDIGVISPVAQGADNQARYSRRMVEQVGRNQQRLTHILANHFPEQRRHRYHDGRFDEPPPPYYPYDNSGQAQWARRLEKLPSGPWRSREDWHEISRVLTENRQVATAVYRRELHFDPDAGVRAVAKLTREQLYERAWAKPMDAVATEIGVSETKLRQLCADSFIPTPGRGHFNFLDPADRPPRTPLPKFPRWKASDGRDAP
jgi:hypothetical protein